MEHTAVPSAVAGQQQLEVDANWAARDFHEKQDVYLVQEPSDCLQAACGESRADNAHPAALCGQ